MESEGVVRSVAIRRLRQRRWGKVKGVVFPLLEDAVPFGRALTKGARVVESVVKKNKNG